MEKPAREAGSPDRDSMKGAVLEPLSRSITRPQATVFARISRFLAKTPGGVAFCNASWDYADVKEFGVVIDWTYGIITE